MALVEMGLLFFQKDIYARGVFRERQALDCNMGTFRGEGFKARDLAASQTRGLCWSVSRQKAQKWGGAGLRGKPKGS